MNLLMIALILIAEPTFGLTSPQDCPNGMCPAPMQTAVVPVSQETYGLFSLPGVRRTETITNYGTVPVVQQPVMVERKIPKTVTWEEEIEVPVQKVVMEKRKVQRSKVVYETTQELVCPPCPVQVRYVQPVNYCPVQTNSCPSCPTYQTRTRTRTKTRRVWFPRWRRNTTGYSPTWQINDGKSVTQHLADGYPGMHAPVSYSLLSGMSIADQYAYHDQLHNMR